LKYDGFISSKPIVNPASNGDFTLKFSVILGYNYFDLASKMRPFSVVSKKISYIAS